MKMYDKIKEKLKIRFRKDRKAKAGILALALIGITCVSILGGALYLGLSAIADKSGSSIVVDGGGAVTGQDQFYPIAWNVQAYEGTTKIAATVHAFDTKVPYPELEIAGGNYLASVSYTGGVSQELVTKATLDALKAVGRWNGSTFWIYTKPSGYMEAWSQVVVTRNKDAATEDQELGISVVKSGSFVESDPTSTTESATAPAFSTALISTYTKPVVVRFVDSNASNLEISAISFKIDGISQTVNKVSGGWYSIVTINGNRTIVVTATRKIGADLNASVVTTINELNPSGASDFFNYGPQLFTETNTD